MWKIEKIIREFDKSGFDIQLLVSVTHTGLIELSLVNAESMRTLLDMSNQRFMNVLGPTMEEAFKIFDMLLDVESIALQTEQPEYDTNGYIISTLKLAKVVEFK